MIMCVRVQNALLKESACALHDSRFCDSQPCWSTCRYGWMQIQENTGQPCVRLVCQKLITSITLNFRYFAPYFAVKMPITMELSTCSCISLVVIVLSPIKAQLQHCQCLDDENLHIERATAHSSQLRQQFSHDTSHLSVQMPILPACPTTKIA